MTMQDNTGAEAIFHRARDLPAGERAAFVQEACGEDGATRELVEELLAAEADADADRFLAASPVADRSEVEQLERIGPYVIHGELGRGAQATVYLAEHETLHRRVALKVLRPSMFVGATAARRFRREAEVTASLEHPGICSVYETGESDGLTWIAMRYVPGKTLAVHLAERRNDDTSRLPEMESTTGTQSGSGSGPFGRRALFIEQAARALHVAHERGLVHRDIKPGNVMVSEDGHPVLLDFGLAHADDGESLMLTRSTDVVGTPSYMAPEQLSADKVIDRRADVYALGVMLYECLCGRRPFEAPSWQALGQEILYSEAPTPRSLNPRIPRDLEVVVQTALDKERGRRYQTALDFAEDLRRAREHEPIRARPISALGRAVRWARRRPALAGSLGLAVVSLVVGLAVSLWQVFEKDAALRESRGQALSAQALSVLDDDPALGLRLAIEGAERAPGYNANTALYRALEAHHERLVLQGHDGKVFLVAASPDGRRALSADESRLAILWDLDTGKLLRRMDPHDQQIVTIGFSPDGAVAVTVSGDGEVALWNPHDGARVGFLRTGAAIACTAFAPGGSVLYAGCGDGRVLRIDLRGNAKPESRQCHQGEVVAIAVSHHGKQIATMGREQVVCVHRPQDGTSHRLDLRSGKEPGRKPVAPGGFVGFTGDDSKLVTRAANGTARLWDLASGKTCHRFDRAGHYCATAVLNSLGTRLVLFWCHLGGDEPHTDVWDLATMKCTETSRYLHAAHPALSPDGSTLCHTWGNKALLVDTATGRRFGKLVGHAYKIRQAVFTADGSRILTASDNYTVRVWSRDALRLHRGLGGKADVDPYTGFSADGRLATGMVAAEGGVWHMALFDAVDGRRLQGLTDVGRLTSAKFDGTGRRILCFHPERLRLWDVEPLQLRREYIGNYPHSQFLGDGSRFVLRSETMSRVVDWQSLQVLAELPRPSRHNSKLADLSPDGKYLAVLEYREHLVSILDAHTLKRVHVLADHIAWPLSAVFTPDGRSLITCAVDSRAYIYDVGTWRRRARVTGLQDGDWMRLRTSADSRFGIVSSRYEVVLFAVQDGSRLADWRAKWPELFFEARFSLDGSHVLIGRKPGWILFVPTDPLALARKRTTRLLTPAHRQRFHVPGVEPQSSWAERRSHNSCAFGVQRAFEQLRDGDVTGCKRTLDRAATLRRLLPPRYWVARACHQLRAAGKDALPQAYESLEKAVGDPPAPGMLGIIKGHPLLTRLREDPGFGAWFEGIRSRSQSGK